MNEANEVKWLKVAVAALVTVSVILAITSYFLYSAHSVADAKMNMASDELTRGKKAASLALKQYENLRARIGTKAQEFDAAMAEISAHFEEVEKRLSKVTSAVNAAVQTAQQSGAQGPALEDLRLNVQRAIEAYGSEPNKNYISGLDRLTEAMENLALLTTQLSQGRRREEAPRGGDQRRQETKGQTTKD
jgi:hypothetical protein